MVNSFFLKNCLLLFLFHEVSVQDFKESFDFFIELYVWFMYLVFFFLIDSGFTFLILTASVKQNFSDGVRFIYLFFLKSHGL